MGLKKFDHKKLSRQLKMLAKSNTMEQAATKLGLNKQQVIYICTHNGISFRKRGEKVYNAVLEDSDIPLIRALISEGVRSEIIALKFECSPSLIRKIKNGTVWTHA